LRALSCAAVERHRLAGFEFSGGKLSPASSVSGKGRTIQHNRSTSARLRILLALAFAAAAAAPAASAEFADCLALLQPLAAASGVSAATFASATRGLEPDMKILDYLNEQPEFKTPIWDYIAGLVDDERIADGKAAALKWASILSAIEHRFGVDRATLVAVWAVESDYGRSMGKRPLIQSLATLSCFGRRQGYFRKELLAALRILEHRDITPERLTGSWAGAFGQTQFMPSTFHRFAIDFEGNGRRDIVDSVPDALASTANYLHTSGWNSALPWGFEVLLPAGYSGTSGRANKRPMSFWSAQGIRRPDGRSLGGGTAGLLLPAGPHGPAFLVTRNFDAIYSYNAAESYTLAIAHLSDRLRGGGPFVTPWPTNDRGLSRLERKELQELLVRRGYDVGTPDGSIGNKTQEAISDFQGRNGLERNGRASGKVLDALRNGH
jgi:lytic murein transglycosylase